MNIIQKYSKNIQLNFAIHSRKCHVKANIYNKSNIFQNIFKKHLTNEKTCIIITFVKNE